MIIMQHVQSTRIVTLPYNLKMEKQTKSELAEMIALEAKHVI